MTKGSAPSSSGLAQLPPSEGKDSKLSKEDMDESEKPEEDVGLLDVSLWLAGSRSDQCCRPSKLLKLPICDTGVFGGDSMRLHVNAGER